MILNIAAYLFVAIAMPMRWPRACARRPRRRGLRGTMLVAAEGLNLFLAGARRRCATSWPGCARTRASPALQVKDSWSEAVAVRAAQGQAQAGNHHLPARGGLAAAGRRARADGGAGGRWRAGSQQGHDDAGRRLVLLDTRNREEFAHGTFDGALTLPIDHFTDLPAALAPHREALRDATVVSFCTGGIRCEKAALWLRADGMDNVLQLDGGILGYFEQVGGAGYDGRLLRVRRTGGAGPAAAADGGGRVA